MPLFPCRWPHGDCSVVLARTKEAAIVALDEVGNAEGCPITLVRTFQMHFVLTDRGELALERLGEGTREDVFAFAYPLLECALDEASRDEAHADYDSPPPDRRAAILCAVEQERSRLDSEGVAPAEPQTEVGREVKGRTDMRTILVDRLARHHATKTLKHVKGLGRPS